MNKYLKYKGVGIGYKKPDKNYSYGFFAFNNKNEYIQENGTTDVCCENSWYPDIVSTKKAIHKYKKCLNGH